MRPSLLLLSALAGFAAAQTTTTETTTSETTIRTETSETDTGIDTGTETSEPTTTETATGIVSTILSETTYFPTETSFEPSMCLLSLCFLSPCLLSGLVSFRSWCPSPCLGSHRQALRSKQTDGWWNDGCC